ncbi:protein phosphatase 2C domain-containing protein [Streptomyces sp. NBC_01618]|uniref:protein phosphatase 2C domain-containing protein n=1 Tax=Streptomyces sp. NBC_01618 TaxID=2975900 RepID=UPI0038653479|nr:protein phosphatase 2C domain-containing protein [Streptomyces sp. NBC_01618]
MSQQGERSAAHEDDWWRRLYDETARDTGATNAADSLDDRFDSASDAVGRVGRGGSVGDGDGDGHVGGAGASVAGASPVSVSPAVPDPHSLPDLPPQSSEVPEAPGASHAPGAGESSRPAVAVGASAPEPPVPPLPKRPVAGRNFAPQRPASDVTAQAPAPASAPAGRPVVGHVGDRPPTYDADPTVLPATVPQELDGLVADTVLDGARYGTYTLRAASVRGDSARFRGEPRRDALLTARFGTDRSALVLVAVATGARATERGHLAAADACRWIGGAVGRSHARLSEDIGAGRRGDLKSGLHRLTDRTYGKLRARAAELGLEPEQYTAGLRCLLLSADPGCRTRIFFGVGAGGLFRLRDGVWQDLEPEVPEPGGDAGGETAAGSGPPPAEPFRFRASVARPGDTLLLCSTGLAEPLRGEPDLARELAERWADDRAPGLAAFLADSQLRVKGYADDRTSVGVWEA